MGVDDPLPVSALDVVDTGVAGDGTVLGRPQGDDARGVLPGRLAPHLAVHDGIGPLAVDVEVVACGVEVPRTDARWTAADLAELEPLGAEEPLHVRRARADAQRVVDPIPEL